MARVNQGNIAEIRLLSPSQEGILVHSLDSVGSAYVLQFTVELSPELDVDVFQESWDRVIDRHPALRSFFTWKGRDRPLQVVREKVESEWQVFDYSTLEANGDSIDRWLAEDRRRGFDLEKAPLSRFALLEMAGPRWLFVWTHHHLILDGWSLGLVLDEVFEIYASLLDSRSPELGVPPHHDAYTRWSSGLDVAAAEAYWTELLAGFSEPNSLALPGWRSGWAASQTATTKNLPRAASDALASFAQLNGLTSSTMLRAAWALTLSRYTDSLDMVFGATVSGRSPEVSGATDLVGLYLNTVPVRVRIDRSAEVIPWIQKLHGDSVDMFEFETTPLADVQRWSEVAAGSNLFETIVAVENVPTAALDKSGLAMAEPTYLQQSNYTLALLATPGDEWELTLLSDSERVPSRMSARILDDLLHVLTLIPTSRYVADLSATSEDSRATLRSHSTGEAYAPTRQSALSDFLAIVDRQPDSEAIASFDGSITYAELRDSASRLARTLGEHGLGRGDVVALWSTRSIETVASILGISLSGATYAPIDPDSPEERVSALLDSCDARAMVAVEAPNGFTTVEAGADTQEHDMWLGNVEDTVYVIHTSGSTGNPKPVPITHANLAWSNGSRRAFYDKEPGRFLLLSPLHFDSSVVGLWWTLTSGGALVLPAPGMELDVHHLVGLIRDEQVTHTLMLPSLYDSVLDHGDPKDLASLEVVIVAGESANPALVEKHRELLPNVALYNEYGPTEGTVWATAARLDEMASFDGSVPIGGPAPGAGIAVLNSAQDLSPAGTIGELWISGPGLSPGYLGLPDESAKRFVELDPFESGATRYYRTGDLVSMDFDGSLHFHGRNDSQVKVRGHRIELEEIESELRRLPEVRDAVVQLSKSVRGIEAFTEPKSDSEVILTKLRDRLPRAMVPANLVTLDTLPRGVTGKVDRNGLAELATDAPAGGGQLEVEGPIETTLAEIWSAVLGVQGIRADDDFFELGGDSLLSIRVIARAHESGITLSPGDFFEFPTIREMAARAEEA